LGGTAVWIQRGDEPIYLWAIVPVRWSQRSGGVRIPSSWEAVLEEIKRQRLAGWPAVNLDLLFYAIFQSDEETVLFLWRGGEMPPQVIGPSRGNANGRPNTRLQPSPAAAITRRRG
jgi:hypothetical protein